MFKGLTQSLVTLIAIIGTMSSVSCHKTLDKNGNIVNTSEANSLRDLKLNEKNSDFDELLNLFKTYYGPYSYKEKNLNINIEKIAQDLKAKAANAKTDEEFAGYVMQFGAQLKDGHVQISLENSASGIKGYKIPILLSPIENKAIIADITDELKKFTGFEVGDEVIEVDGVNPMSYIDMGVKYKSLARDLSNQHTLLVTFYRSSFMTDLIPKEPIAHVHAKKANGTLVNADIPWETTKYNMDLDKLLPGHNSIMDLSVPFAQEYNDIIDNHRYQMGQVNPVFLNPSTQKAYKFVKVYPSDESRKKFGLEDKETPPIYAALYKYSGKTILLVRQATYSPQDFKSSVYLKAYMALFYDYHDLADVMVLDQTHNPGGSYCAEFYNLFAKAGDNQAVELLNADRKWINELKVLDPATEKSEAKEKWDSKIVEAWGLLVEKAYDLGLPLSEPVPLFTGSQYAQPATFVWDKPMLVLIDELAGSCGDMFPMVVKSNGRAKLFGQNTMGLGGNVEEVGILTNSRIHVRLTRGLFYPYKPNAQPAVEDFIENNGVSPDYPYSHTIKDFRGGFVDYVKAFSDKAIEQIPNN